MTIAFATDIHLSFLEERARVAFYARIADLSPDALLISGDIGKGLSTERYLAELALYLPCPIYFVLGNHDFWVVPSMKQMRERVSAICQHEPRLIYVTQQTVRPLTARTCIIGHDGWADARLGDMEASRISLNDFVMIHELCGPFRERRARMQVLADEAVRHVAEVLPEALSGYEYVLILTHVPPFAEACIHDGDRTSNDGLPYFACKAMGDLLRAAARSHPGRRMTVLCGHTHCEAQVQVEPNLLVRVGAAEYRNPAIAGLFQVD